MAKKRIIKSKKKQQSKASRVPRSMGVLSDPRVRAWDMLLRDPCSANLAAPCYTGTDSGYLVRTVDLVQPQYTGTFTSGNTYTSDVVFQVTPFNFSTTGGIVQQSGLAGATLTLANLGRTNFITDPSTVKRQRPVAACVKFIPTGPLASRQGTVGLAYISGTLVAAADAVTAVDLLSDCQRITANGSSMHEVRWLPTAVDENFTETSSVNGGAGTVLLVARGVDGTAVTTTTCNVNGYFEITCVWEWVPARSAGAAAAPKVPLPYTSQQVLSTIGDFGAYIFEGMRTMGDGIIRGAAKSALGLVTRGVLQSATRGPAMPLLTY